MNDIKYAQAIRNRYKLWGKVQLILALIPIAGFANRMMRFAYDAYGNDMIQGMLPRFLAQNYTVILSTLVFLIGISTVFRGIYYKRNKEEIELLEGME